MSRQGPKSAAENKQYSHWNDFKAEEVKLDHNISKSKAVGIYLKHQVSEIVLLLACNQQRSGY